MPRLIAALLTALLLAAPLGAQEQYKELDAALRKLNDAFAKPNPAVIRQLMTDDHQAITPYYNGAVSKEEQLRTLPDLKMTVYQPGKEKIQFVHRDVAIISYPLTMKGTFRGKAVVEKSYAVAVWVRQGGQWREASYQETALSGK